MKLVKIVTTCALCKQDKTLQESHLIPAGVLKKVGFAHDSKRAVALMDSDALYYQSRQAKKKLLCSECEKTLNFGGERDVIPKLFHKDGFELLDDIRLRSDYRDSGQITIVEGFDFSAHLHFLLGYLWKESITEWQMLPENTCYGALDTYNEGIERFLLGQAEIPDNFRIAVIVFRDASAKNGTAYAATTDDKKMVQLDSAGTAL